MGVGRAFIGTRGNRLKFAAQAQMFLNAGMAVDAYLYLYWSEPGAAQAVNCLNISGDVPVGAVWLDVEFDEQNPWPGMAGVNSVLYAAYERMGAIADGLYTSRSMWAVSGLGQRYAGKRLWDANPRSDNRLPPLPFTPYGGWTGRAVVQYTSSVTVCGLNVDMDADARSVVEADAQGEDAMTQAEKDELVARVVAATNAHTDWKLLQLIAYLRNTGVKCAPAE